MTNLTTKARETSDKIVKEARNLFAEKGFYGASLSDVAKQVGISKPGVLHYYPSKEKLYAAVLEQLADNLLLHMDNALNENQDDEIAQLDAVVDGLSAWVNSETEVASLLLRDLMDNRERAASAVNWYLAPLIEGVANIIKSGQVKGLFQPAPAYNLVISLFGAHLYYIVSTPSFKQMLSAADFSLLLRTQTEELKTLMRCRLLKKTH